MEEKFRCYILADDYRWHILAESIEEYHNSIVSYLELMRTSKKENNYYIKNLFLTRSEINKFKNNRKPDAKVIRLNRHLRIVKD